MRVAQGRVELFRRIYEHRFVLFNFVDRDLKVKYAGTAAGYLWSLLEPLSLVLIYYFIFVVVANRGDQDYALVVILGLLPWNYLSASIMAAANALRANKNLILRIYLPREVYVIAAIGTSLVVLCLSMIVTIPFLVYFQVWPGPRLLLWPVSIAIISLYAVGIGLVVACANVMYKDVSYLVGVVMRLGLYFSAAIYPVTMVPEKFRYYFLFNPMALCLSMARNAVLNRPMPFAVEHVASAVGIGIVLFVIGVSWFPKLERRAVKFL